MRCARSTRRARRLPGQSVQPPEPLMFARRQVFIVAWGLAVSAPAAAAVVSTGANGFVVHHEVTFEGTTAQAWDRLVTPSAWWSPKHTYSQDARNLSLTLRSGGCWCEDLGSGGFVQHMQVVFVRPG